MTPTLLERVDGLIQSRAPRPLRGLARRALYLPVDVLEALSGRRRMLIPPRGLRWAGLGDYTAVGQQLRQLLVDRCRLQPRSVVLDVGCGTGRLAVPLTEVLSTAGEYHGFDVWRPAIRWCTRRISRRHPGFHFRHVDVHNTEYNWTGTLAPEGFVFPYTDARFDVVVAISVYTHLLAATAARYATETARVLRPGGFSLMTFFLLNPEAEALTARGLGHYRFPHAAGAAWVAEPERPEAAVAYREDDVRSFLASSGLEIVEPILFGVWCGRTSPHGYQDTVIARRVGAPMAADAALGRG